MYVINALSQVDTLANRDATPALDHTLFTASDTDQTFVGVSGAWKEIGRIGGTAMGAIQFEEIADAAAPATNRARLYVRDTGGKTELVVRFATGAVQAIAIEP